MTPINARRVLAVVPDLFFASKLAATAAAAGVELELVSTASAAERLTLAPPVLTLIDLHAPDAVALVRLLKIAAPEIPLVGFFSHIEIQLRADALAAGADAVLPRSKFVIELAGLLERGLDALNGNTSGTSRP